MPSTRCEPSRTTAPGPHGPLIPVSPAVDRLPSRAGRGPQPSTRRAGLLAAQLPATDAAAAADRDATAAAIQARLRQIDTAQNSCILELEQLPADPADTAAAALRGRIRARFADLHAVREQLDAQLAALAAVTPRAADPALLDDLPLAGDILPGLPAELKARLLEAFDIQVLWNKPGRQATVHAEITDATPAGPPGYSQPRPGRLR